MSAALTSTRLRRRSACGYRHPVGAALVAVAVGLAVVASLAGANDGYFGGNGGPVVPLDHPDIELVRERIAISGLRARCRFEFVNHGAATTVLMGFPEWNGEDGEPGIREFHSFVDGREVATERKTGGVSPAHPDLQYDAVYTWPVEFAKGQRRRLESTYDFGPNGGNASHVYAVFDGRAGDTAAREPGASRALFDRWWDGPGMHDQRVRYLDYILQTGSLWKGAIRDATITIELDRYDPRFVRASPPFTRREGTKLVWRFRNLEPTEDIEVAEYDGILWLTDEAQVRAELHEIESAHEPVDSRRFLLAVMRRGIQARNGATFDDAAWQEFFDLQWWYRRKPGFRAEHLTATDRRSIALIEEAEAKLPPEPSPGN